jgi:phospholipase C
VPVISQLARQFAVCDQWHASAPNQTWPNRFFMHCSTANGYVDNAPSHFPYRMPTIFTRFDKIGQPEAWRVYFHDMPQSLTLADLWEHVGNFRLFAEFRHDALNGTLPSYSFLEPRYFPDADLPNDQHPPHVVTLGEQLIADVYNCLRKGPNWTETLLIVTYDEHGGCYDHVMPPPATSPVSAPMAPFGFDRYGVRVPAVLISPYIRQGTVLRAPAGGPPFDHTSVIATLRKRFALGPPLSGRDAAAPDLSGVLTLGSPDNIGPEELTALPYAASPAELARARAEPLSDLQKSLVELAARLPTLASADTILQSIGAHLQALENSAQDAFAPAEHATAGDALHFAKQQLGKLFAAL